jgi:hypothetical protein
MKAKLNLDIVNCILLIVILVLVIVCCVRRENFQNLPDNVIGGVWKGKGTGKHGGKGLKPKYGK